MTECSTPPSEEVEWVMYHEASKTAYGPLLARTAWQAHQQVKGAPAFGSCRVRRVSE